MFNFADFYVSVYGVGTVEFIDIRLEKKKQKIFSMGSNSGEIDITIFKQVDRSQISNFATFQRNLISQKTKITFPLYCLQERIC